MSHVRIGEIFERRYRIDALIGSGGTSHVYRAHRLDAGVDVALKIFTPDHASGSPEYSARIEARFRREAELLSKLDDPNTIKIYEYGIGQAGLLFMAFEYIEGRSVEAAVAQDGAFSAERTYSVLVKVLSSLREAHEKGIIHRDIKSSNIMVYSTRDGLERVKLLDFGIAKEFDADLTELTRDNSVIGTLRFMSPEQLQKKPLKPSTDLFSLGLVCYHMLVGQRPNEGMDAIDLVNSHLNNRSIKLPFELEVNKGLRRIINRMLEKNVEIRYSTAAEVLGDLIAMQALSAGDGAGGEAQQPMYSDMSVELMLKPMRQEHAKQRRGTMTALGVGGAALALVFVVFGVWTLSHEEEPPPEHILISPSVPAAVYIEGDFVGRGPIKLETALIKVPFELRVTEPGYQSVHLFVSKPTSVIKVPMKLKTSSATQ